MSDVRRVINRLTSKMEPTRQVVCAIMSRWRAAHLAR
jgi:hypothetical protein